MGNHQRRPTLGSCQYLQHRQVGLRDSEQRPMERPMQQVLRGSGFALKRPVGIMRTKGLYKKSEQIEGKETITERRENEPREQCNVYVCEKASTCLGGDVRATNRRNVMSKYRAIIPRMLDCLGQSVHGLMQTRGYHPHVPCPPFMGPSSSLVTHPP